MLIKHSWIKFRLQRLLPEKDFHYLRINLIFFGKKILNDQPNLAPWFKDKDNHSKYDWYVFNSHWNYEKFRMAFDIPTDRSVVIKKWCC